MRGFDPNHTKWKCCCMHVIRGAYLLGAFKIFVLSIFVIRCVVYFTTSSTSGIYWHDHISSVIVEFVSSTIHLLSTLLMIFGIYHRRVQLIIQHWVIQILGMIMLIYLVVAGRLMKPEIEDQNLQEQEHITLFIVAIVFVSLLTLFEMYLAYIIWRCYQYVQAELEEMGNRWTMFKTVHRQTMKRKTPEERDELKQQIKHQKY